MSKKIFIVYGHHNTKKSFNASIRDTFIDEARKNGHEMVEKVGLYWHFVDLVWVFVFLVFYLI